MKKMNQWACYNRIWSWSPMPCEKHGPRASVTTKTSAFGLGFCLRSPSGHFSHGMGDHDQILQHTPLATERAGNEVSNQIYVPGLRYGRLYLRVFTFGPRGPVARGVRMYLQSPCTDVSSGPLSRWAIGGRWLQSPASQDGDGGKPAFKEGHFWQCYRALVVAIFGMLVGIGHS